MIGIHIDPDRGFRRDLGRYERILEYNGIPCRRLDASQAGFWDEVRVLRLFIFHWGGTSRQHVMAPTVLDIVETELKVPCYPDFRTRWSFDDKIREFYLLERHSFPVIPTYVFWNHDAAMDWIQNAEFPLVFKLKSGASSLNVIKIPDRGAAARLIKRMFGRGVVSERIPGGGQVQHADLTVAALGKRLIRDQWRKMRNLPISPYEEIHKNYVLFQQFLPENKFDTRITVIGDRAFASRRHARMNDFRSSGSGQDDWSQEDIDPRCIDLAFRISEGLGFQCMSYDFLFNSDRQPMVSEMSYTSPDWTIWNCPGYWDRSHGWHPGHYWPQFVNLRNLLGMEDLRQPEMSPED